MANIAAENIDVSYTNHKIIDNICIDIVEGKITAIVGPNGSGKSTLLKTLSGSIKPISGSVTINNLPIESIHKKELAKILSSLPQTPETPKDMTVIQLISYGRYAHQSLFKSNKTEDKKYVDWALQVTNLTHLANKTMDELSGGQRQRAWIALSLAQNSNCLFLDELTTYLDIRHQIEILSLLKELNTKQNKTILMVLHDLNHAIHYADYIAIVEKGKIRAYDTTENILKNKILEDVFKVKFRIFYDDNNLPFIISNELSS